MNTFTRALYATGCILTFLSMPKMSAMEQAKREQSESDTARRKTTQKLIECCRQQRLEEARQLMQDPDQLIRGYREKSTLTTALHEAIRHESMMSICADILKNQLVDINEQDREGNTALHIAVAERNIPGFDLLVYNEARKDIENDDHLTVALISEQDGVLENIFSHPGHFSKAFTQGAATPQQPDQQKTPSLLLSLLATGQDMYAPQLPAPVAAQSHTTLDERLLGDRASAAMLAAAAGDALGAPIEEMNIGLKSANRQVKDQVAGHLQNYEVYFGDGLKKLEDIKSSDRCRLINRQKVAAYTDDTRMAMLVMDALIEARIWAQHEGARCTPAQSATQYIKSHDAEALHVIMTGIAKKFIQDVNAPSGWNLPWRSPGGVSLGSVGLLIGKKGQGNLPKDAREYETNWWQQAETPGHISCGSVMHAYPFGIVFHDAPELAARLAAEHSKITHNHQIAIAACAVMATGMASAIQGNSPEMVIDTMCTTAQTYGNSAVIQAMQTAKECIADHKNQSLPCRQNAKNHFFCDAHAARLLSWDADQAVAAAAYVFGVCPDSPEDAIAMGANTPGDSDTIAALAGALVGARTGMAKIPASWQPAANLLEDSEKLAYYGHQVLRSI